MPDDRTANPRGRLLALGLGATVAMWVIAYVAMMRPGMIVSEVLFGATLMCPVVAGWLAARRGGGVSTGLAVGAVSAAFNLLLIGSIVGSEMATGAAWVAGLFAASIGLAGIGAAAGRGAGVDREVAPVNWFHAFVCVAAVAVFLLLITGGLVTGLEAGLAVPDWPRTFGHNMLLYPLSEMTGGVYYEHAHRLYGMLVGLTTIVLTISLFRFDSRGWLRLLGVIVLVMVCVQGVMGGLRVTGHLTMADSAEVMRPNLVLAIIHGVFGQVVFATIVAIAAFTSTTWRTAPPASPDPAEGRWTAGLLASLLAQLVLGALYRHLNAAPDVPAGIEHGVLTLHILVAGFVTALVLFAGGRAWSRIDDRPVPGRVGRAMIILVVAQLLLGGVALVAILVRGDGTAIPSGEVLVTSAHHATGALLLALATLLAVWTRRLGAAPEA